MVGVVLSLDNVVLLPPRTKEYDARTLVTGGSGAFNMVIVSVVATRYVTVSVVTLLGPSKDLTEDP